MRRAVFLQSLLAESGSGQKSELLEKFLPRRNSLAQIGLEGLFSQRPPIDPQRLERLNALEAKATAEVDGARTVGDPRLAHAADSAQWMAFDEMRKVEFEKQRELDWQAVAERMVRDDYAGVREAPLDAAAAATILTPVQTKATQISNTGWTILIT
ncbi:MAG: hypothetical protein WCQ57_13275 [Verrucomicrobiota bacterium]